MAVTGTFTTRRVMRLVSAGVALLVFFGIQAWQMESGDQASSGAANATDQAVLDSVRVFLPTTPTSSLRALVMRVVDGDTIDAKIETTGEQVKVRFLGMNTPESVDPRRPVQCFGKEASNHLKELLEGKQVLLVEDLKADDRDKYGRWLRNVVREEDLLDVNATLVAQGYANSYLSFPLDAKRKAQIRLLEQEAKTNQRGLWSPSTCEGKK